MPTPMVRLLIAPGMPVGPSKPSTTVFHAPVKSPLVNALIVSVTIWIGRPTATLSWLIVLVTTELSSGDTALTTAEMRVVKPVRT